MHIHAVLHLFVIVPTVKLAPLVLGSGIRSHSGLPDILEFSCRRTSKVARLRGRSLGRAAVRVVGDIIFLGMLLFKGCGQSNQNLFVTTP